MHVALGVSSDSFPIADFLSANGRRSVQLSAGTLSGSRAPLSVASNPERRRGEWVISDQYTHRHPAWSAEAGFPKAYAYDNPPYLFIVRVGTQFHARFALEKHLKKLGEEAEEFRALPKGIRVASPGLMALLSVQQMTVLDQFDSEDEGSLVDIFNPSDVADGRKQVIAAIFRRLGQRAFRKKLMSAYQERCAISGCRTPWVLQAAHITPYRGMKTNSVQNGLLLRADIHTLFDLGLISIDPARLRIRVSRKLRGSPYDDLEGRALALPARSSLHPSPKAIKAHYDSFVG